MITIGFSTRKDNQKYIDYLQSTSMYKEVQIIQKINNGEKSLSEVYNEIIDEAQYDIVVLCHDDLEFDTKNWGEKIVKQFQKNPDYGILGLAGTKYLDSNSKWWEVPNTMYGIVNHKHEGKKWTSTYSKDIGNKIEDVILVDGLFLAINKNNLKHKFDESIKGFHFYDLGLCLPNFLDNVKVGVIFDVRVTHLSIGQTNQEWENNRIMFSEKYIDNLPIDINDKSNSETFIFVHNQDIIVDYEEKRKFKNLYNYKYVFLGKGNIDKLENYPNVLIARNFEENIEQYPLFTAYTGWYLLWKNNLIKTKYVNLFEYDIILSKNIDQFHTKLYNDNVEMIGYVPFPIAHYQFVENNEWNEHILPIIKKTNHVDMKVFYKKILGKNPNAVWSSTSNTTFRTDIFNEYMKWFHPIAEQIKVTKTCGHAFERAITFFTHLKNKRMLITNGILKHLQIDSHKTQGHSVDMDSNYNKLLNNIF
jgi:hypothetical protein